ncbi:hypothetical protein GGQ15_002937 [Salinibacter ruber]|nr:hypothetical protein [Salinibacter ruber]MCS4142537.1 hypothetical protein [Salinibacter ruber]
MASGSVGEETAVGGFRTAVGGVYDGGPQTADRGHEVAGVREMCSERNAAVVFGRLLSNGGVGVKGRAKGLKLRKQGLAVAIRLTEWIQVVKVAAALDEMETGDGFEEGADGDSQKAILLGVALSCGAFRALSEARK